ncbi:MarR family winged helix-turn-helix transcriptional regulator [Gordonia sp. NPDC003424]
MTSVSAVDDLGTSADVATLYHLLTRINRTMRIRGGNGNLSAGVAAALWTIINNAPIRLSALAERESVSAPTMSRIVAALDEKGYIERTTDPEDGRAKLLSPTAEGVEVIASARSQKARLLADAIEGLDDEDRATVCRGLSILADALGTT